MCGTARWEDTAQWIEIMAITTILLQEEKGSMNQESKDRDKLYERAEQLSNSLVDMGEQLNDAVNRVNLAAANNDTDSNQPLSKLVKILNNQLQALTHLDARTDEIAAKVDQKLSSGEQGLSLKSYDGMTWLW